MTTSGGDLIEALFGQSGALSRTEIVFGLAAAIAVIAFVVGRKDALTVALGLRYLGVLLMGSLIIVPAATAKRLSRNLNQMLALSAVLAVMATVCGTSLGWWLHRETGPLIVTIAAAGFLLTFMVRRG